MDDLIGQIFGPDRWPTFAYVAARLGGVVLIAPVWSTAQLTRTSRAGLTALLAMALLPSAPTVATPDGMVALPVGLAVEVAIGVLIGLTAAVLVQGVILGGEVISMQMGLRVGAALSPSADFPAEGIGQIKAFLALLIYLAIGGHLLLIEGLAASLRAIPPGGAIDLVGGVDGGLRLMDVLFGTAVRAASPVLVSLLLGNIGLVILHRAVPNLNAMMVALPLTLLSGLLVLWLALPVIGGTIAGWMEGLGEATRRIVAELGPGTGSG